MSDVARDMYDSLDSHQALERLIEEAEAESLHLECKTQQGSKLGGGRRLGLAKSVSGFTNTEGGVILWGMSTTNDPHSSLDLITEIVPIGPAGMFANAVRVAIPRFTTPAVTTTETKVLRRAPETRGVAVTYVPKTTGDPVQDNQSHTFWMRAGDRFVELPYAVLQALFRGTESPDLELAVDVGAAGRDENGRWTIPLVVTNRSSAVARDGKFLLMVIQGNAEVVGQTGLRDVSNINPGIPGTKTFQLTFAGVVHRGLPTRAGSLAVKMKPRCRILQLVAWVFADKMRARQTQFKLELSGTGCQVTLEDDSFMY